MRAPRIELCRACGTRATVVEVFGNAQDAAAGTAQHRLGTAANKRPDLGGMVGESLMAVEARYPQPAALHAQGDYVVGPSPMRATAVHVDIDPVDRNSVDKPSMEQASPGSASERGCMVHGRRAGPGQSLQPGSARGYPSQEESLQPGSARGYPSQEESLQPGSARGYPSQEKVRSRRRRLWGTHINAAPRALTVCLTCRASGKIDTVTGAWVGRNRRACAGVKDGACLRLQRISWR